MNWSRQLSLTLLLAAGGASADTAPPPTALAEEARGLVRAFAERLKPSLQQALGDGGTAHAIEVCASEAPKIADALSATSGWSVKRVSLRARNASRAQPDNFEQAVLREFDRRAAAGESPTDIHYAELTPSRYRYMQAQGVDALCLLCHGENLDPDIRAALARYYPDDTATGYRLGQVRGAISLSVER